MAAGPNPREQGTPGSYDQPNATAPHLARPRTEEESKAEKQEAKRRGHGAQQQQLRQPLLHLWPQLGPHHPPKRPAKGPTLQSCQIGLPPLEYIRSCNVAKRKTPYTEHALSHQHILGIVAAQSRSLLGQAIGLLSARALEIRQKTLASVDDRRMTFNF